MAIEYFLVVNGKPEGPFSLEQLKGMSVRPSDFLKTAEMVDYKEAHDIAELRELFHFDKRSVAPQYFAGFDQRWTASALDWLFVGGGFIVLAFLAVYTIDDKSTRLVIGLSILALIPITKIIYHIVMECSPKQATYGKQILKIKVCDLQGRRIGTGRSISRNLFKIFSIITIIGYPLSFFNKRQQCLHDIMAETLVVKDRLI
ncbi:MAG: RDD family protein [Mucilaginibacter sp.]|nr:RDD family protein [Mucilaginibacter sp.]